MPLTKTYCKGSGLVVRHNNTLDQSSSPTDLVNTAAGKTLGATPAQDDGWSFPPTDTMNTAISSLYPANQLPTFRDHSTAIKRPSDTFSMKHTIVAKYPWYSSSSNAMYGRAEAYTNNSLVERTDLCLRLSVYRGVDQAVDETSYSNLSQMYTSNGPSVSFRELPGGEFGIFFYNGGGSQNQLQIAVGEVTRGVWHDFIFFITFSNTRSVGKLLAFKNNKICRTRVRSGSSGSYTYSQGLIPTVTGTSASSQTLNTDVHGDLPLSVNEGGMTNLVFWKGPTLTSTQSVSSLSPKWGLYKPDWTGIYNSQATTISNLNAGMTLENAILKNPSNPAGSNYLDPALREMTAYLSVAFGYVGAGETFEDLYLLLSDGQAIDAGDRALIDAEPELNWFTLNGAAPTTYVLTVDTVTGGTANFTSASLPVGTVVNLVSTPNSGFTFTRWEQFISGSWSTISGAGASFNYTTTAFDRSLRPVFTAIPTYTLTVSALANGTTNISTATQPQGTVIPLVAIPNSGFIFDKWEILNGIVWDEIIGAAQSFNYVMTNQNKSVRASFVEGTPPIPPIATGDRFFARFNEIIT
mgnify:CR=1 FL=1